MRSPPRRSSERFSRLVETRPSRVRFRVRRDVFPRLGRTPERLRRQTDFHRSDPAGVLLTDLTREPSSRKSSVISALLSYCLSLTRPLYDYHSHPRPLFFSIALPLSPCPSLPFTRSQELLRAAIKATSEFNAPARLAERGALLTPEQEHAPLYGDGRQRGFDLDTLSGVGKLYPKHGEEFKYR